MYIYVYIYIYIYMMCVCVYRCVCIYRYIYNLVKRTSNVRAHTLRWRTTCRMPTHCLCVCVRVRVCACVCTRCLTLLCLLVRYLLFRWVPFAGDEQHVGRQLLRRHEHPFRLLDPPCCPHWGIKKKPVMNVLSACWTLFAVLSEVKGGVGSNMALLLGLFC